MHADLYAYAAQAAWSIFFALATYAVMRRVFP